jgi:hypothetical protein
MNRINQPKKNITFIWLSSTNGERNQNTIACKINMQNERQKQYEGRDDGLIIRIKLI